MDLLRLRYFVALAKTENLTETAKQLHIARSTLSAVITKLQAELGINLFDRVGRNMRLNEIGLALYRQIERPLSEIDSAIKNIKKVNDLSILIGLPTAWSDMFAKFASQRPDIHLTTHFVRPSEVEALFASGKYDFWLTGKNPAEYTGFLDAQKICSPPIILAVPEAHPLASKDSVSIEEIKNEEFLFPYPYYSTYHTYLNLCRENNFEPRIVGNAYFSVRQKMVTEGKGVTFMDCYESERSFFRHIALLKITGISPRPPHYICKPKGRELSPNAQAFLDFVIRYRQET